MLASQKLEQLRALPAVASGGDEVDRAGRTIGDLERAGPVAYRRLWTVTAVSPGLSAIAVVVSPAAAGDPRAGAAAARGEVRFLTLRAEPVP
jgi:hypothetical protein